MRRNREHLTGLEIFVLILAMMLICLIDPSGNSDPNQAPVTTRQEAQR